MQPSAACTRARVANFSGVILLEGLKNELARPNWTPVLGNSFPL